VDLKLSRGGEKFFVQCKQWRAHKVGVEVVRELYGVMAAHGATGGFVVTSGRFTSEAGEFARGRNIKLLDGPALHAMIRRVGGGGRRSSSPAGESLNASATTRQVEPACPKCSAPMTRRKATRGTHAGNEFWGCTKYPGCRGTIALK